MYKLDWPIPGTNGVTKILSQSDISIKWTEDEIQNNGFLTSGISYIVPKDTGQLSGQEFSTIWTSDYIDENQANVYVTLSGKSFI